MSLARAILARARSFQVPDNEDNNGAHEVQIAFMTFG